MRLASAFLCMIVPLSALGANEHGTLVREAALYVSPGGNAQKLIQVERGRDMVVLERTNFDGQSWCKVFVTIVSGESRRDVTGWLRLNGVVTPSTPNADAIIFGEAVDSERQAEQRGGRKGAAQDAMRLYYRVFDLFPQSPLAPEALWRAADIRWQLEKADIMVRPSAHEMDPDVRTPIDDNFMKEIIKRFPQTRWADLAAYDLLDNKLCGDWKGLAKCPEAESQLYLRYAEQHPSSPRISESLYNAAWRQAALVDIYTISNAGENADTARKKAIDTARKIVNEHAKDEDWKARALDLIYKLEQRVPVYGSLTD